MFGSKKEPAIADAALEQVGTIIGPGAVLEGPLTTKDSTRIDGIIKGNVTVSGALIVGQEAKITGTVSCLNAYIAGEVNGNISAPQGKVEISDSGKVVGDVSCKGIVIDENAVFHGQCSMTGFEKTSAEIAKERMAAEKDAEKKEDNKEENKDSKEDNKEENKDNKEEHKEDHKDNKDHKNKRR